MKTLVSQLKALFVLFAIACVAERAHATGSPTLEVYFDQYGAVASLSSPDGATLASHTPYITVSGGKDWYFGGHFGHVEVYMWNPGLAQYDFKAGFDASNVARVWERTSPSTGAGGNALTLNFNGTGDGCNGTINDMDVSNTGDIYMGGSFTSGGGYAYFQYLACYRTASGGWAHNGMFASDQAISDIHFDANGLLEVHAYNLATVYGASYSGDTTSHNFSVNGTTHIVYWHDVNTSFNTFNSGGTLTGSGWWTTSP